MVWLQPAANAAADPTLTVGGVTWGLRLRGGGSLPAGALEGARRYAGIIWSTAASQIIRIIDVLTVEQLAETATAKVMTDVERAKIAGLDAALALKAALASPALTGTPTVPTAAPGTATQQAASTAFVAAAVNALVNAAPGALDTLNELAQALGNDPNFATTMTNALAARATSAALAAEIADRRAALAARLPEAAPSSGLTPLVAGAGDAVPVWLDGIRLDGVGLGPRLRRDAASEIAREAVHDDELVPLFAADNGVPLWLRDGFLDGLGLGPALRRSAALELARDVAPTGPLVPVIATTTGQVALWLDQAGGWHGPGIDNRLTGAEAAGLHEPRRVPGPSSAPVATDGRTLHRLKAKLAALRRGEIEQLRVAVMGDSWAESAGRMSGATYGMLADALGITSAGWLTVSPGGGLDGVVRTSSPGWVLVDGSITSVFPYGAGPDGHCLWTDAAGETLSYANVRATEISITRHQHGGTWRWRIDGGAWTAVADDAGGDHAVTVIGGLSGAPVRLEIDTTGNGGIVAIAGCHATVSGAAGAEVSRCGNAGTTGLRMLDYLPYVAPGAQVMCPDLVIVILGTNDYRTTNSAAPAAFEPALRGLMSAVRAAVPDCGFIMAAPSRTDAVPVTPLSDYRDTMYRLALEGLCEFVNLHDAFPDYPTANALGLMADDLHQSPRGSRMSLDIINDHLLNL